MSRHKEQVTDAHRADRIKLLQTNPEKYFENKRRINFGFVTSSDNRSERRSRR
ncbi:hypothetical protein HMPREF0281_02314 [Corynebacterium ammoniagenes DSM 20306]|uniref:Uncharacterized protein n=1 Tax=Corynebacterium ammoniagenes DSM 20306 TaxID=649754 RepID=A0ABP2I9P7_CORAM|nr:hypothetical protein HMPREF0281_02314 [Corynebacterium ammoniagenes DSM 20306]